MATLMNFTEETLCRTCSGRVISDAGAPGECPRDEKHQAECLFGQLFLACFDTVVKDHIGDPALLPVDAAAVPADARPEA